MADLTDTINRGHRRHFAICGIANAESRVLARSVADVVYKAVLGLVYVYDCALALITRLGRSARRLATLHSGCVHIRDHAKVRVAGADARATAAGTPRSATTLIIPGRPGAFSGVDRIS